MRRHLFVDQNDLAQILLICTDQVLQMFSLDIVLLRYGSTDHQSFTDAEQVLGTMTKGKRTSYEKKRSSGIRVTVIKTGDRSKHCVITASSLEQLMSQATEKLKSTTAIRRGLKNVNNLKMVTFW